MRKGILLLALFSLISISCKKGNDDGKIVVVSSITIINDMVKEIAKDKVEAISICGIGYDPHTYIAVPRDSRTIARADLIVVNGFGLEGWINKLIDAASEGALVVTATDGIKPLKSNDEHGDPDPHAWFNAENAKVYVKNIVDALIKVDPKNKDFYTQNGLIYIQKLDSLHKWAKEEIASIPEEKRVLITSHDAFRYFGRAYGIEVKALQGISTESKAQTQDVAGLIQLIKNRKLPSVFIETSVSPKLLEQISLETGATVGGSLYSDSIDKEGTEGSSYIKAFRKNVLTITNALKK